MFMRGTMFKAVLDREIGKCLQIYIYLLNSNIKFFNSCLDDKTTINRTRAEDIL